MKKFNPYAELGLEPGATAEEVDKAFRERAKETHPDNGGDPEDFQRVRKAVVILRDPKKRKHYDETGDAGEEKAEQHPDFHAFTYLAMLIHQLCDMPKLGNIMHMDLPRLMRDGVGEDIGVVNSKMAEKKRSVERANRLLGRFKRTTPGPNLIEEAILNKLRDLHEGIAQDERAMSKMKRAQEILEEFTFERDEDPTREIFRQLESLGGTDYGRGGGYDQYFTWQPPTGR